MERYCATDAQSSQVAEVQGMEGESVVMQDIFVFEQNWN